MFESKTPPKNEEKTEAPRIRMTALMNQSDPRAWGISVAIHVVVLVLLALVVFTRVEPQEPELVSIIEELEDETDFLDLMKDPEEEVSLTETVSVASTNVGSVAAGTPTTSTSLVQARAEQAAVAIASNQVLNRPIASVSGDLAFGGEVRGLEGEVGFGDGDAGSVDRIVLEIKRHLERGKVLVVWVMDGTESLKQRREQIINRFDRIYYEIRELGMDKDQALMTAVVAFGQNSALMTEKPTADQATIKKAVREIQEDDTGKEFVFTAVRDAIAKHRSFANSGRRKMMVIVLTDEVGDDSQALEETIRVANQARASVYTLGPLALFGKQQMTVPWTDKESGESFDVPVNRGPESARPEGLSLPYWTEGRPFDLISSGFGPWGLSRLAKASGGIYFIYDDDIIPGPKFLFDKLKPYSPDFGSLQEYDGAAAKSPVRQAILNAAKESVGSLGRPPTRFDAARMNEQMTEGQRIATKTLHFVNLALSQLQGVEASISNEPSLRWQAHYDLMMGRLLAARVRATQYNLALQKMKREPIQGADGANVWILVPSNELAGGEAPSVAEVVPGDGVDEEPAAAAPPPPSGDSQSDAAKARQYLERVAKEHPGTPWAAMAERELGIPFGVAWQSMNVPEAGEAGDNPAARERQMRREEAAKRVPKDI